MTQAEKIQNIIDAFRANGMTLTLGQLVKIDACEYRKWVSKIRIEHPGYDIPQPKLDSKHPSNNLYTLIEINSKLSLSLEKQQKIKEYTKRLSGYPENHNQRAKIQSQIEGLKSELP